MQCPKVTDKEIEDYLIKIIEDRGKQYMEQAMRCRELAGHKTQHEEEAWAELSMRYVAKARVAAKAIKTAFERVEGE